MTAPGTSEIRIALIPARGGSKRIPRKNIKEFCGRPMIAYPIETARQSNLFHRIIVSTEDEEIAEIARGLGAEIPFMRPSQLANDTASTWRSSGMPFIGPETMVSRFTISAVSTLQPPFFGSPI